MFSWDDMVLHLPCSQVPVRKYVLKKCCVLRMTSVSVSAYSAHLVNCAKEVHCSSTLVGSIHNFMTVPPSGLLRSVLSAYRRQC